MRAFLYDRYGYYPPNEDDHEFLYQGWRFRLEALKDQKEEELVSLNQFLGEVFSIFPSYGGKIIANREGNFISEDEYGPVALIAVKEGKMQITDLLRLHQRFSDLKSDTPYTTQYLEDLWEEKVNNIEEKVLPSIRVDDYAYQRIMVAAIHSLGLAENAMQYLKEIAIDYGKEIAPLSLCHRRLDGFDSFTFFNPLNFVLDSPIRDLAEAWKYQLISRTELLQILPYYRFQKKEISLLFARILFPTRFFDLLEKHYGERMDVRSEILDYYRKIPKYMDEMKMLERDLVRQYGIRPISWLNEP